MTNRQFRQITRLIHLVGGAIIGTYIYSPWGSASIFTMIVQWVVVPVLTLTGLALWQQARLSKLFKRNSLVNNVVA